MKIGILSLHRYPKLDNYIRWIELSGASVEIIPYTVTKEKLQKQLSLIDGVIWTGGSIQTDRYTEKQHMTFLTTLQQCFYLAIQYNDAGRKFPIWGSCLGFELLVLFASQYPLSHIFDHIQMHEQNSQNTIEFTTEPSRLKHWFSAKTRLKMAKIPCANHHHKLGFDIQPLPHIRIVSVDSGFINMIEYKAYPFYGVQFHPERPFSPFSEDISRQFSLFFHHECLNQ